MYVVLVDNELIVTDNERQLFHTKEFAQKSAEYMQRHFPDHTYTVYRLEYES